MDIQILRRETEADHLAVEGTVNLMSPALTQADYIACLQCMHGVVAAWETRAAALAPDWLQPTLAARRRTPLIERDLAHFNASPLPGRSLVPDMDTLPSLLGTMYVMEGSTLGGQFIAKHVAEVLHLTEGEGNAYFRGHGSSTGAMWKEFCEILKTKIPDSDSAVAVSSAKAMFAAFGAWMMQEKTGMQERSDPNGS